jgi:transcriptional regulator with XRE-family HTH domain
MDCNNHITEAGLPDGCRAGEVNCAQKYERPMSNDKLPLTVDKETADDTLGGRIVHAREAAGLSTKQLAGQLGMSAKTVSNWENDRAEPRSNNLNTLAGLLGVSPTWLLAGRGAAPLEGATADADAVQDEIVRIKAEAARLVDRIESLGAQLASGADRRAE